MESFSLLQYQEAGCNLIFGLSEYDPEKIYKNNINPCNSNCRFFDNGNCIAYQNLQAIRPLSATKVVCTNTVREEAKRLGLSLSEVRKIRRNLNSKNTY